MAARASRCASIVIPTQTHTWRLRIDNAAIALEDSVYLGRAGQALRTRQVVATGALEGDETLIPWALTREDRKKRPKRKAPDRDAPPSTAASA